MYALAVMTVAPLLLCSYMSVVWFGESQNASGRCMKFMLLVVLKRLIAKCGESSLQGGLFGMPRA